MIGLANKESGYDLTDQQVIETLSIAFVEALNRKRAEEALRESEERHRSLFQDIPVGLYRSTPGGQILDANPALVEMLGYPDLESLREAKAAGTYVNAEDRRRWQTLMESEGVSEREAISWITKVDKERRKWTQQLYGVDPWDPLLYDMVIKIDKFDMDEAVEMIYQSARLPRFKATKESQREMEDLALAYEVKAELAGKYPGIKVTNTGGNIVLYMGSGDHNRRKLTRSANGLQAKMKGINNIEIHEGVSPPPSAV